MHQHAAVVVGLVLPIDPAVVAATALAVALGDVEERLFGARVVAEIGEGRRLHADQRGQLLTLGGTGQVQRGRQRRDPHGLGTPCALLRCKRDLARHLGQAFIGGRETIGELRLGETVLERIGRSLRLAGFGFCAFGVRSQHSGVGRLAALNEHEGKRHEQCGHRRPAPSKAAGTTRRCRGRSPACAIINLEFRISSDHPPAAPRIHPRSAVNRRMRTRLGDVKLPEKLPIRKRLGDHGIVSRLWDRHDVFAIRRAV